MSRTIMRVVILAVCTLALGSAVSTTYSRAGDMGTLPAPQLVTNAWMFMAGFRPDPEALKGLLPEGLEPHPDGRMVINMYTVPNGLKTSGFGAYTLTYITIEVADHDSYTMGSDAGTPGRYFVYYFNDSPLMRDFTSKAGIPATPGHTNISTDTDGNLHALLTVGGVPFIETTARVGNMKQGALGGHLNYFGLLKSIEGGKVLNQVVKYPIPWVGRPVSTADPEIKFIMPESHPLSRLAPQHVDWAVWIKGSFVYPQYQVIHEFEMDSMPATHHMPKSAPKPLYR